MGRVINTSELKSVDEAEAPAAPERRAFVVGWCVAMLVGVLLTYLPPGLFSGNPRIFGIDYETLHRRRVQFALDTFHSIGRVPGWFPREQLGTPFWSNIQNFPFVPTRLILLPVGAENLYTRAILLSACLAALFTFLYARSIGMRSYSAAIAGWTFASAGFFASRALAGHLHLLESYPSLPMLLWLVERCAPSPWQGEGRGEGRSAHRLNGLSWKHLLPLGLAATCTALCGHPQLPMYSLLIAGLYVIWRLRGIDMLRAGGVLVAGVGCAAFVLVPMISLIGRSTRVLPDLQHALNDIALPYERIVGAFFSPWRDGWPELIPRTPAVAFHGYPNPAYFWDTFNYITWLPWVGALVVVAWSVVRGRRPRGAVAFIVLMGVIAFALALPWAQVLTKHLPGTFVRAPTRLTYPVTLALVLALGAAVQIALQIMRGPAKYGVVAILVGLHAFELARTSRTFVTPAQPLLAVDGKHDEWLKEAVGEGRVSYNHSILTTSNRQYDDIGFYDSIQMARSFELLMALGGANKRAYLEELDGDQFSAKALAACGVNVSIGYAPRPRAKLITQSGNGVFIHEILDASPRVSLVPRSAVQFVDRPLMLALMRPTGGGDPINTMYLPREAQGSALSDSGQHAIERITHDRPAPDTFILNFKNDWPGYVRVIETFDPGWSAELDDLPIDIIPANEGMMAIPVASPGTHKLRLTFHTPGRIPGATISLLSLAALLGISFVRTSRDGK